MPPSLGSLLQRSRDEGHGFVERTVKEWRNGTNRFDKPGEFFFLAIRGSTTVGMCGLNVDPFTSAPTVGRLRHLYVVPEARREAVASTLVQACLTAAEESFVRVRLRTFDPSADAFYRSLGFERVEEPDATHSILIEAGP